MKKLLCKLFSHTIEQAYTYDLLENDEPGPTYIDYYYCSRCLETWPVK